MVFSYYNRLTRAGRQVYKQSDAITSIRLSNLPMLSKLVMGLRAVLEKGHRGQTQAFSQETVTALTTHLKIAPVRVEVMSTRPSKHWGELHGLYTPKEVGQSASIRVWMRTAQRRQVVAFRTFLRTLLHELCHHLVYELFHLADSLHTEGFYKRESSLLYQLLGKPK